MPALALTVLDPAVWHDAIVRVLAGGLGALAGLMLLTFGIVVSLARMRWPGR
ncbi:MAG TPA: hypothetical protein VGK50_03465 [Coriobacteriia bacterium]|jgi:hypothetical protein